MGWCADSPYQNIKGAGMKQISIFMAGMLVMTILACSTGKDTKEDVSTPIPVNLGKLQHKEDHEIVSLSGTIVSPGAPSTVSFLVSGQIVHIGPREGDYVKKGQLLASVDPTDFQLTRQAASAQVDMARATVNKTNNSVRPEQLEQSRIAFEHAEDEYRRMKQLYESRSLAPNDYNKFKAAFESARQQYELAKNGGQKEDKAQAQAALEQAEASEKLQMKHLSDASLYSPISGFISKRFIELGETATPGRPVFEIVELDTVEVSVGVPETDVHLVRVGQKAIIKLPALPEETFEGTVCLINVSADPSTRTFMTRISMSNLKHTVRIGMVAEVQILGDKLVNMDTIPVEAIERDPQGAKIVYVYFPDQRRVYARRVETGVIYGREIEIRQGLTGDDQLVVAGQERLRDGAVVSVSTSELPEKKAPVPDKGANQ